MVPICLPLRFTNVKRFICLWDKWDTNCFCLELKMWSRSSDMSPCFLFGITAVRKVPQPAAESRLAEPMSTCKPNCHHYGHTQDEANHTVEKVAPLKKLVTLRSALRFLSHVLKKQGAFSCHLIGRKHYSTCLPSRLLTLNSVVLSHFVNKVWLFKPFL